MPRSAYQKKRILYLRDYLLRHSDEGHPVSASQIIDYLGQQDIAAERKTIYDDLETLRLAGMDVVSVRLGSGTGYYIGERDFQFQELKLLVDSVQSSKFITEKKSVELIRKLERLTSDETARQLHRQVWVRGRIKTMNESIYYNVDAIHSAIDGDMPVTFRYYDWNVQREMVFRRNGARYEVSPWALMWDNENYYMIAFDHEEKIIKHFRVDKMNDIRTGESPRMGAEAFSAIDMAAYSGTHFGMFSGDVRRVRLLFENGLAGPVIDRFGADVSLVPYDEDHFSVTISAAVNIQFFGWLCGFGARVRILSPEDAAEEMRAFLAKISALYAE